MMKNCHHDAHHTPLPPRHVKWPHNRDNNEEGDEGWEMRAGAWDADMSWAPGKFFYYFIHFLNYTNVLQVPWWRTATMMLAIHHSHLDVHWSCWALHLQHVHWWRRPGGKWIGRMQWNTMVKRREVLGLLQWILGCADVWAQLPQWDYSSHHRIECWSWKTKSSIC